VESPSVWRSAEIRHEHDWCIVLAAEQRAAIVDAARTARAAGITPATIGREHFPLASMIADIDAWSAMLEHGRGFVLLRGFPVGELTEVETELAYIGLGTHLGQPVGQNASGDLLTHIRDERLPAGPQKVRLYRTRERQDFHTDGADIIGLLCLPRARRGGESRIASSGAVYNEILRRRPDLLEVLYQPMAWDRQDEHGPGERPWFPLAPFKDVNGVPRVFYIGWYVRDAQRHADAPRLTDAQQEAMQLIESIANDPSVHVEMDFEPGDVQLLNNARILHSREAYEDDDDPAERRHLLRLWLAAHHFASVEPGLRRGISATRRATRSAPRRGRGSRRGSGGRRRRPGRPDRRAPSPRSACPGRAGRRRRSPS
jgi:hypothetical protein